MEEPGRGMMEMLIQQFAKAPDSQVGEHCKGEFKKISDVVQDKSDGELYDFLADVAENSCCETSAFVKAACDMRRFYKRPAK